MKKPLLLALILLSTLISACLFEDDEEEWDAEKVCPETGMNAYGMENRGTFVDERDGRVYKYTTIGDQVMRPRIASARKSLMDFVKSLVGIILWL